MDPFSNIPFYDGHESTRNRDDKKYAKKTSIRYASMDNSPMVWIGFYWFPLFLRYHSAYEGNATFRLYAAHESLYYRLRLIISFSLSFISFFFLSLSHMFHSADFVIHVKYYWKSDFFIADFSHPLCLSFSCRLLHNMFVMEMTKLSAAKENSVDRNVIRYDGTFPRDLLILSVFFLHQVDR